MKNRVKILYLAAVLCMTGMLSGCQKEEADINPADSQQESNSNNTTQEIDEESVSQESSSTEGTEDKTVETENKIKLIFEQGEMVVTLENNSASQDLLSRLPMTLTFEDYNGTEKISYLEEELDLTDAPDSTDPKKGDLTYYAPWGNLAFFYQDFRHSPQLIPLGKIESGQEYLEDLDKAAEVTIEQL